FDKKALSSRDTTDNLPIRTMMRPRETELHNAYVNVNYQTLPNRSHALSFSAACALYIDQSYRRTIMDLGIKGKRALVLASSRGLGL
ncbi:hypothetical protein ACC760_38580, partial [Rhizobium ruizarguesonis]